MFCYSWQSCSANFEFSFLLKWQYSAILRGYLSLLTRALTDSIVNISLSLEIHPHKISNYCFYANTGKDIRLDLDNGTDMEKLNIGWVLKLPRRKASSVKWGIIRLSIYSD
jgi:hypothetical protein